MSRKRESSWISYTILTVAIVVLAAGIASAQDAYQVTYYANPAGNKSPDSSIHIINPGTAVKTLNRNGYPIDGQLCAFIYVFNDDEQEEECCGCLLTADSEITLSLHTDLLGSPFNMRELTKDGVIKIVSGPANVPGPPPSCDPAAELNDPIVPTSELRAWSTHTQAQGSTNVETEEEFAAVPLSADELSFAENLCSDISGASGKGICTCGYGD